MAIDAIGVTSSDTNLITSNSVIGQEDFLKILLSQLQFQDPLKPIDNQQFVAQLAQFSALEINRQQSAKIDTLLSIQDANQAIAMIGRTVEVQTSSGSQIGTVSAVSFASGEGKLSVKTDATTLTDVSLSNITVVR